VDNHSLKLNRAADYLELECSETLAAVDRNRIVISSAVNIRSPELFPSAIVRPTPLGIRGNAHTEQHKQTTNYTNSSL